MFDEDDNVFTRPIVLDEEATKRFFEIIERQSKEPSEKRDCSKTKEALERGKELLHTNTRGNLLVFIRSRHCWCKKRS